jgi:hypothetical protein
MVKAVVGRAWMSFAVVVVACLALAPAANAAFGFQGLSAGSTNPNAGANSDVNIHVGFSSPADDVKNLTVGLPPGMVGDPTTVPLCTLAQLQSDGCPAASQVGTVTTSANARLLDPLPLTLPLTVDGSLYNVVPAAGQPARFGIVLRPIGSDPLPLLQKIIQVSDVQLRKSDFGLNTLLTDIPNMAHAVGQALGVPIDITAIDIHLNGTVGGQGFMRNPTSCGTKTTKFTASSYANPNQTATGQATYTSVNCGSLPFSPTFKAWVGAPGRTQANTAPPVKTQIAQDPGEAGLKDAQVLLPISLNPDISFLTNPCPVARFRTNASACPARSIVGSARANSPLLSAALTGPVVIVAGAGPADLPRLGVDLRGPLSIQLFGSFVFTEDGIGQAFNGLPDIPISKFILQFKRDGLLVNSRNQCRPPAPAFLVSFAGWNGATQNGRVGATVQGCG